MQIGKYKLGRYHGIIEKKWNDNTYSYETDFSSENDLMKSVYAIEQCVGKICGVATDNPKILSDFKVYRGPKAVEKLKSLQNNSLTEKRIKLEHVDKNKAFLRSGVGYANIKHIEITYMNEYYSVVYGVRVLDGEYVDGHGFFCITNRQAGGQLYTSLYDGAVTFFDNTTANAECIYKSINNQEVSLLIAEAIRVNELKNLKIGDEEIELYEW